MSNQSNLQPQSPISKLFSEYGERLDCVQTARQDFKGDGHRLCYVRQTSLNQRWQIECGRVNGMSAIVRCEGEVEDGIEGGSQWH